jgi:hypothetical protein
MLARLIPAPASFIEKSQTAKPRLRYNARGSRIYERAERTAWDLIHGSRQAVETAALER